MVEVLDRLWCLLTLRAGAGSPAGLSSILFPTEAPPVDHLRLAPHLRLRGRLPGGGQPAPLSEGGIYRGTSRATAASPSDQPGQVKMFK